MPYPAPTPSRTPAADLSPVLAVEPKNPPMSLPPSSAPVAKRRHDARWFAPALATLLLLGAGAARADGDADADGTAWSDVAPDPLSSAVTDPDVFATLLPNEKVITSAIVDAAIASVLVPRVDPRSKPVVPASPQQVANANLRPLRVDGSPVFESPATLQLAGQVVRVHADGMPGPNAPSSDPFVRVLPRAVNPADVQVGAHWGTQERIPAPLLSGIAWNAQADVFAGPALSSRGAVRRSLRITAQWDNPDDLTIGFTPGVEHTAGSLFEHHVTGLQASTVDKTQAARWRSFIEVSGEKLGSSSLIDNATAKVNAGATYTASNSTQLDVSVSRGTTPISDLQSTVGLQVHF